MPCAGGGSSARSPGNAGREKGKKIPGVNVSPRNAAVFCTPWSARVINARRFRDVIATRRPITPSHYTYVGMYGTGVTCTHGNTRHGRRTRAYWLSDHRYAISRGLPCFNDDPELTEPLPIPCALSCPCGNITIGN